MSEIIPENRPEVQPTVNDTTNGTTPHGPGGHILTDPYAAYEMFETLEPIDKLQVIRKHFTDPDQWLKQDVLEVLTLFRKDPPGMWGRLRLAYKRIGGNIHDLQDAVDHLRT